ncbi:MAG TPA: hypothetical protein VJ745_05400 [Gaiellaceae bacterium]|nr:hypothetical protein [Gaiellaceae bacterium]
MSGRDAPVWLLVGAGFGVSFVVLNLVNLVFEDGDVARDLVAIGLGGGVAAVAFARYRGWKGVGR